MAAATGAAIVGGVIAAEGAKSAANTQAGAARDANSMQERMYNQQRADQEPWRQAGMNALQGLGNPEFQQDFNAQNFENYKDPGYDFRMQEGQKAINNAASARGMGNSGATLKALARYGQDFASNEFTNAYNRFNADRDRRFNRLASLANVGQTANSQLAQAGQNYGNRASDNLLSLGNARAAGQIGQANAMTGAIGQGLNFYQQNQMMSGLKDLMPKQPALNDPNTWATYSPGART